ncbi:MAG: hypothetical protein ALECFALPRED_008366 [Alectoria fallacina]|uniref:Uncharacterized protein n=1 Tax=Alectoria fallacina TaxID=1903189 RepID=A0A8H3J381_9LECA|nr:MAG: hypothetical protein ALECFALPRED_008366 [Alectoria fallacina]
MASRMKKLFHRQRDSDTEQPPQRTRAPTLDRRDPALRTSRYESTEPGQFPQTGDYPVKGNDSSVILQQGRNSSVSRSRRNSGTPQNVPYRSTTPNQYEASKRAPYMTPPPGLTGFNDPYQQSPAMPMGGQEERPRRDLPQGFSGLSLGNVNSPTTVTQTVTTTRTPHQGYNANRGIPQIQRHGLKHTPQEQGYAPQNTPREQGYAPRNNAAPLQQEYAPRNNTTPQRQEGAPRNNTTPHQEVVPRNSAISQHRDSAPRNNAASIRPVNEGNAQRVSMSQTFQGDLPSTPRSNAYDSPNPQDEDDTGLAGQNPIPRKQIGTSADTPYSSVQASSAPRAQISHSRQQSVPKPLPSIPVAADRGNANRQTEPTPQSSSILNRSRPVPTSQTGLRDAQDIVNQAKTNTYDTQVVERVAPAVVHEEVHRAVHHVREEVITREIHTHDVYHRILPVVDVEVLPPRHFLPVEGGGLVEISAQEVPGRGSNWVIAETASKIPSDQAAPSAMTQFTARNFPGREGDAVKYMSPEGYEKTSQTWVHPPELEEGARLTGQSWPMVIGEKPFSGAHGFSTPKATKRKSPKNNPATQANSAQRAAGGRGRA